MEHTIQSIAQMQTMEGGCMTTQILKNHMQATTRTGLIHRRDAQELTSSPMKTQSILWTSNSSNSTSSNQAIRFGRQKMIKMCKL